VSECTSYSRRPGEGRDPYAVSVVMEDGASCLCDNKHQWLWVPAFAGKTLGRYSHPASRCELLRFGGGLGLRVAQFVAREFAHRGARQFVDEFQRRGNLVLAELAGEKRLELVQRESLRAGAQFDEGLRRSPR